MWSCVRSSVPVPQGQNIVLNMNDHGFVVCAYNRTVAKVDQFLANEAKGRHPIIECLMETHSLSLSLRHQCSRGEVPGGYGFQTEEAAPCDDAR